MIPSRVWMPLGLLAILGLMQTAPALGETETAGNSALTQSSQALPTPVFSDNFDDYGGTTSPPCRWTRISVSGGTAGCSGFNFTKMGMQLAIYPRATINLADVEVDGTFDSDTNSAFFGVVCRSHSSAYDFLVIDDQQNYVIGHQVGATTTVLVRGTSQKISPGNLGSTIFNVVGICDGSELRLLVGTASNGTDVPPTAPVLIATTTDSASQSGQFGIIGGTYGGKPQETPIGGVGIHQFQASTFHVSASSFSTLPSRTVASQCVADWNTHVSPSVQAEIVPLQDASKYVAAAIAYDSSTGNCLVTERAGPSGGWEQVEYRSNGSVTAALNWSGGPEVTAPSLPYPTTENIAVDGRRIVLAPPRPAAVTDNQQCEQLWNATPSLGRLLVADSGDTDVGANISLTDDTCSLIVERRAGPVYVTETVTFQLPQTGEPTLLAGETVKPLIANVKLSSAGVLSSSGSSTTTTSTPLVSQTSSTSTPAPASNGLPEFQSETGFSAISGNINCNAGRDKQGQYWLLCVVFSTSGTQGVKMWWLSNSGTASAAYIQVTPSSENLQNLAPGRTWSWHGINCASSAEGLTCGNESGHGFSLNRQEQTIH